MTTNKFCWVDLSTDDVEKAKGFYASLFDWSYEAMDIQGSAYTMIVTDEGPKGGIVARPRKEIPVCWTNYISIDEFLGKKLDTHGLVRTSQ